MRRYEELISVEERHPADRDAHGMFVLLRNCETGQVAIELSLNKSYRRYRTVLELVDAKESDLLRLALDVLIPVNGRPTPPYRQIAFKNGKLSMRHDNRGDPYMDGLLIQVDIAGEADLSHAVFVEREDINSILSELVDAELDGMPKPREKR